MVAQQPNQQPHMWSGSNKTIQQLEQERNAFLHSLETQECVRRLRGKHFSHMEHVWGESTYRLATPALDFDNITRNPAQGGLYQSCYRHISNEIRDPDWTSGTANHTGNTEKIDPVGNLGGQTAHLLSHTKICHRAYPFLAEAAIGIKIEDLGLNGHMHTNRRKLLVGVKGGFQYTSLKGHKFNKMYLKLQGEHFDSDKPSVLIVPLLPLDQILNWATDDHHAVDYDAAVFTFGPRKETVASEILRLAKGICSPEEITTACQNVTHFMKGIAGHLLCKNVFESLPEEYFTSKNATLLRWKKLITEHLQIKREITIPIPLTLPPNVNVRIAKARMSRGTSLPDPWLLLAKSAINYSGSNGQKLMPACPPSDDSDSEDDDYEIPIGCYANDKEQTDSKDAAVRASYYNEALRRGGFRNETTV